MGRDRDAIRLASEVRGTRRLRPSRPRRSSWPGRSPPSSALHGGDRPVLFSLGIGLHGRNIAQFRPRVATPARRAQDAVACLSPALLTLTLAPADLLQVADESKIGTNWTDDELDLIVADYFAMLSAEQAGQPYVKAHHGAALMERIGRTHRSVEFKHMNISAVLAELGLPTIRGYKAKANYQAAIFPAIDRLLSARPALLMPQPLAMAGLAETSPLWEEDPPAPDFTPRPPRPEGLERLVRKFDPVERDFRNRVLGHAGEALVVDLERRRLEQADRRDLARKVRWISQEDGDGAGYDVHSFDPSGADRLLEVKTTYGGNRTPFFLTRNEKELSEERPDAFRILRVYEFAQGPRLFRLWPPLGEVVLLETETWRAGFG